MLMETNMPTCRCCYHSKLYSIIALVVILLTGEVYCQDKNCTDNDIRLYGESNDDEGMVQLCNSSNWEAVCDYSWDCRESTVACRQLGYDGADTFVLDYGPWDSFGFGPYSSCSSDATSLTECSVYDVSYRNDNSYCNPAQDTVKITCYRTGQECTQGDVRLVNGTTSNEGRVEYCYNGYWNPLCTNYDHIYGYTAYNLCNKLGFKFNSYAAIFKDGRFGNSNTTRNHLTYISCTSSHASLDDCSIHFGECSTACSSTYNHYGIRCFESGNCTEGDLRLADGDIDQEGRLEVCVNGIWGGVCDTSFTTSDDGHVVCSELGYQRATVYYDSHYGDGLGPILYSSIGCAGDEVRFSDCSKYDYFGTTCSRNDVVGLLCKDSCEEGSVQLVDGDGTSYGTVLVCVDEIWGLISDSGWDTNDAIVICKQLGHVSENTTAVLNSTFSKPRKPVFLNNVDCSGDENNIFNCKYISYELEAAKALLGIAKVAGVNCLGITPSTTTSNTSMTNSSCSPQVCSCDVTTGSIVAILTLLVIMIIGIFALLITILIVQVINARKNKQQHVNNVAKQEAKPSLQYEEMSAPKYVDPTSSTSYLQKPAKSRPKPPRPPVPQAEQEEEQTVYEPFGN